MADETNHSPETVPQPTPEHPVLAPDSREKPGSERDQSEGRHQDAQEQDHIRHDADPTNGHPGDDGETTFPRAYVQQLRDEAAKYRQRAGRADEAARRLLEATVRSAVRDHLADPSDLLTFVSESELVDGDGWPDSGKITAAAEALAASKPHLAPRRPRGDIGQGAAPSGDTVNLAAMMRSRAS